MGGWEQVLDFNLVLFLSISNAYNFCSQIKIIHSKTRLIPKHGKGKLETVILIYSYVLID